MGEGDSGGEGRRGGFLIEGGSVCVCTCVHVCLRVWVDMNKGTNHAFGLFGVSETVTLVRPGRFCRE